MPTLSWYLKFDIPKWHDLGINSTHTYTQKTNMTGWKITFCFNRRYIDSNGWFFIVMFVFWGVRITGQIWFPLVVFPHGSKFSSEPLREGFFLSYHCTTRLLHMFLTLPRVFWNGRIFSWHLMVVQFTYGATLEVDFIRVFLFKSRTFQLVEDYFHQQNHQELSKHHQLVLPYHLNLKQPLRNLDVWGNNNFPYVMTFLIMQQKQCMQISLSGWPSGSRYTGTSWAFDHLISSGKTGRCEWKTKRLHTSTSVCPKKKHDSDFQAETLLKKEEQKAGLVSVLEVMSPWVCSKENWCLSISTTI